MLSNRELQTKLYMALADWENAQDLGALSVHPLVPGYRLLRLNGRVNTSALPAFEVVLLCDTTQQVVFYSRVVVTRISDLDKPGALSLSWRSSQHQHDSVLHKVAANVLTNYILNGHIAILSDGNPVSGGKFFWEAQISAALGRGHNAYVYNAGSASIERIKDDEAFIKLKDFVWGSAAPERNLVILSKDDLPLHQGYTIPMAIIDDLDSTDIQKLVINEHGFDDLRRGRR